MNHRQRTQPKILGHVGILIFIDQNIAEGFLIAAQDFRMFLEQGQAMQQKIAEIGRIQNRKAFLIDFIKVLGPAIGELDTFIDPFG